MDDAFGPRMSRRRLLRMIGQATSSAVMYQAMTSLGHAAEFHLPGPDRAPRRPEGRLDPHPGRRPCRHGRGARAAQGRLQGAGARISEARRRPQLVAPRRRQLYRARRRAPGLRLRRRASTSIRARGASPITTARCSITASGSASRSSPSSRSTTTPTCTPAAPSAASRSASGTSLPTSTGTSPSCWPRPSNAGQARRRGHHRGQGDPARRRCAPGARSTRTMPIGQGYALERASRLRPGTRAAASTARPSPSTPIGLRRRAELAALAAIDLRRCNTSSSTPCSSRSAAWT